MHGAGSEKRVHRQVAFLQVAITENQQQVAVAYRLFGLRAQTGKRLGQGLRLGRV